MGQQEGVTCWDITFLMISCQVLVHFLVVYCANFSNIRYQKSINIKKVISDVSISKCDCVMYLFFFLLFTAKFIDIWKHEKVTWKGISDLSFRDRDCVRFLFTFLLSTVKISQISGTKYELLQRACLIYQFPIETVSGKVSFSWYVVSSANSLFIAQQKVVTWKSMLDNPIFDWDCRVFGHLSLLYCANFYDIGQEKGVKWQDISDISKFEWDLSVSFSISRCLLVKLLRNWARKRSNK